MNTSASIRTRLFNIARRENIAFNVIIVRYLHERMLYRISCSRYADHFLLKGGNFMYAIQGLTTRPTKDIDLLGLSITKEAYQIREIFSQIANLNYNDGVWFDTRNIQLEQISEQNRYNGIRMVFPAGFDTIKTSIQIDIGFGDQVTPQPVSLHFPVLLENKIVEIKKMD